MEDIAIFLNNNGLSILNTNLFGLYLPLLIFSDKKSLFSKENNIMVLISIVGCILSSFIINWYLNLISDGSEKIVNQIQIMNVFPILYLLLNTLKSRRDNKYNFSALWLFSFLPLWLADSAAASIIYDAKILFDSGIGGAGILDGLFLCPAEVCLFAYIIQKVKSTKYNEINIFTGKSIKA